MLGSWIRTDLQCLLIHHSRTELTGVAFESVNSYFSASIVESYGPFLVLKAVVHRRSRIRFAALSLFSYDYLRFTQ